MTTQKRNRLIAWSLCLFVIAGLAAVATTGLIDAQQRGLLDEGRLLSAVSFLIILAAFAILGALIITHQPHNRIGWLLLIPVLARLIPLEVLLASPPETLTVGWWLLFWLGGWAWMPLIFPVLLLPLHFPTGRPPTARWNWINWLAWGMWALLAFVSAFAKNFADVGMIPNPIGFLPPGLPEQVWNSTAWRAGVFTIATGSVLSLFVRYSRAQRAERQQIKWLAYAGILFAVAEGLELSGGFARQTSGSVIWVDILFYLSVLAFAVAIGIAILRYRLFDIDIIIRKTLVYGALTALLALVYFSSVVLLQTVAGRATAERSPLIIVVSTLVSAALFSSLRRRVQAFIDRRFYRRKYDAAQVLARYTQTARDEVELETLIAAVLRVVEETVEPDQASVWLKPGESRKG